MLSEVESDCLKQFFYFIKHEVFGGESIKNKLLTFGNISENLKIAICQIDELSYIYCQYFSSITFETQSYIINNINSCAIKYMEFPSEELQIVAVKANKKSIALIKNPTKKAIELSQRPYPKLSKTQASSLNNESEQNKFAAIKLNPSNIQYIDRPSKEMQEFCVKHSDASYLSYVKNVDISLDFIFYSNYALSKSMLVNKKQFHCKKFQKECIDKKIDLLKFMDYNEDFQIKYAIANPISIIFHENLSEKLQVALLKDKPRLIEFIEKPCEKAQMFILKKHPLLIIHIKNPCEEVKKKQLFI